MWIFFICFVIVLGGVIFLRFQKGRWKSIQVIEDDDLLPETHQPEIKTEARWM